MAGRGTSIEHVQRHKKQNMIVGISNVLLAKYAELLAD